MGPTDSGSRADAAAQQLAERIGVVRRELAGGIFARRCPPPEVLEWFATLESLDRQVEPKHRFWKTLMWSTGIFMVITLFLAIPTTGLTLVVAIPLAIAWIVSLVQHSRYARLNLDDRRYQLPCELIRHLAVDMKDSSDIDLQIDFNPYRQAKYQTAKDRESVFSSVTRYQYEVPWLNIKGRLLDGTRFRLKVTQAVKRKEKAKRKRTKVTEVFREKANLLLAVDLKAYPHVAQFPQVIQHVQPPAGFTIAGVKVRDNVVQLQAISQPVRGYGSGPANQVIDKHSCLQLFLAAYKCLGQCRYRSVA